MRERLKTVIFQWLTDHNETGNGYAEHNCHDADFRDVVIDGHYDLDDLLDRLTKEAQLGAK